MNPRFLLLLLFAVMALVGVALPVPADALVLDATQGTVDAWPALRVLADPTHELGLADMLRRRDAFQSWPGSAPGARCSPCRPPACSSPRRSRCGACGRA